MNPESKISDPSNGEPKTINSWEMWNGCLPAQIAPLVEGIIRFIDRAAEKWGKYLDFASAEFHLNQDLDQPSNNPQIVLLRGVMYEQTALGVIYPVPTGPEKTNETPTDHSLPDFSESFDDEGRIWNSRVIREE